MAGISFIVRIRDEEKILAKSIRSLAGITVLHEIVLILHQCTDSSPQIAAELAAENPNIRILTYDYPVSRAGYETLATDVDSVHSFIRYSNWCAQQARYHWIFRWDADFIASDKLRLFMSNTQWTPLNMRISVSANNSTTKNREFYLCGALVGYKKHMFWENPEYKPDCEHWHFADDVNIDHASELSDLKTYWSAPAWFETEDSDEARLVKNRVDLLTAEFGPEPKGLARASNPECDTIFRAISAANPAYVNFFH